MALDLDTLSKEDLRAAALKFLGLQSGMMVADGAAPATDDGLTAVLVGTELRNLWFGYTDDTEGDVVTLKRARQVVYWSADVKGAGGLAVTGPSKSCRVGPVVAVVTAHKVTTVALVSTAAVRAFESGPWA